MAKYYEGKAFRSLQVEWTEKLREAGFKDHEDRRGNLKQYDRRTIAWDNMERIRDFFIKLDHYLTTHKLPAKEEEILRLYSEGRYVKDIAIEVNRCTATVKNVIARYKKIILK